MRRDNADSSFDSSAAVTAPWAQFQKGDRLGHYLVLRHLGSGGEASVFLTRDLVLRRLAAVKVLHRRGNQALDVRGLDEARLIATLDHPNVIRVYHVGQVDGAWYMAMEYLDGGSLAQRIDLGGPMDAIDALRVGAWVSDALQHAHTIGVFHRDVKPQNLLLSKSGTVKLADFGLATKARGSDLVGAPLPPVGTPLYTAPEVWLGEGASVASDIYSLGACIFYLLNGRAPFQAARRELLREAHVRTAPVFVRAAPSAVEALVLRCLAKDPADRPSSAEELYRDIRALLRSSETAKAALRVPVDEPVVVALRRLDPEILARPPLASIRLSLDETQKTPAGLVVWRGPYASAHHRLTSAVIDESAEQFQRLLEVTVVPGGAGLVEQIVQRLGLVLPPAETRPNRIVAMLAALLGSGKHGRGVIAIDSRRVLSQGEANELRAIASRASEHNISVLAFLSDGAAVDPFSESGIVRHSLPEMVFHEWTDFIRALAAIDAKEEQCAWSRDAVRLAGHLALMTPEAANRIVRNATALRRLVQVPMVTTWCVLGGAAHDGYVRVPDDLLPRWRTPPETWPETELRALLQTLRLNEQSSNVSTRRAE